MGQQERAFCSCRAGLDVRTREIVGQAEWTRTHATPAKQREYCPYELGLHDSPAAAAAAASSSASCSSPQSDPEGPSSSGCSRLCNPRGAMASSSWSDDSLSSLASESDPSSSEEASPSEKSQGQEGHQVSKEHQVRVAERQVSEARFSCSSHA